MPLILITPPSEEPVTLAEARLQCRIDPDSTADDARLQRAISTARRLAEHDLGRPLMPQTWERVLDAFPPVELELGKHPVRTVESIQYIGADAADHVMDPSAYYVDAVEAPGWVLPAAGTDWPDTADAANAVRVRFTCGYPDAASVPTCVRDFILLAVEHIFRGTPVPPELDRMLDSERVYG